jgi:hypothetical protein
MTPSSAVDNVDIFLIDHASHVSIKNDHLQKDFYQHFSKLPLQCHDYTSRDLFYICDIVTVVSERVDKKNPSEDGHFWPKHLKNYGFKKVNIINHTGRCY